MHYKYISSEAMPPPPHPRSLSTAVYNLCTTYIQLHATKLWVTWYYCVFIRSSLSVPLINIPFRIWAQKKLKSNSRNDDTFKILQYVINNVKYVRQCEFNIKISYLMFYMISS